MQPAYTSPPTSADAAGRAAFTVPIGEPEAHFLALSHISGWLRRGMPAGERGGGHTAPPRWGGGGPTPPPAAAGAGGRGAGGGRGVAARRTRARVPVCALEPQ